MTIILDENILRTASSAQISSNLLKPFGHTGSTGDAATFWSGLWKELLRYFVFKLTYSQLMTADDLVIWNSVVC